MFDRGPTQTGRRHRRSNAEGVSLRAPTRGPLAQLAEQQTLNLRVWGSSPRRLTTFSRKLETFGSRRTQIDTLTDTLWRKSRVQLCRGLYLELRQDMTVGVQGEADL